MRTVNEVVADVLANPEAYTDAFPVAEPEQVLMPFFNPETATVTMSGISALANGESLTPEIVEYVRQRMLSRRFVSDESHPRDRVTMVNMPLREDSVAARIMNQERRLDQRYFGDGSASRDWEERVRRMAGLTTIDDPSMGTADQPIPGTDYATATGLAIAEANERMRPDHYRVTPGRCHCGFTSMFAGDMENHLAGPAIGQFGREWWMVCECGASALCREVGVARNQPISWSQLPFDPNRAFGPTIDRIYLCDTCRQRRGIR